MSKPSTYLYSKQNRELYKATLEEYSQRDCLLSRNIIPHLEMTDFFPDSFYDEHLKKCTFCWAKAHDWRAKRRLVKEEIPVYRLKESDRKLIYSECRQIIEATQDYKLVQRSNDPGPMLTRIQKSMKEILKICFSKTFIVGIVLIMVWGYFSLFY